MKKISYIMIITAAIFWGSMGIFVNVMKGFGVTTMELVFLRAAVAAVCIGGFALIRDRSLFKIKLRDIWIFIGTGLVSYVFFTFCYFYAMELCSVSVAAVLLYTSPVFVSVLGALFLKEKFTKNKLAAIIMTFVGCALVVGIVGGDIKISAFGVLVGVGSGFWYSLYTIFGSIGLKKYNTVTVTMYTFLIGAAGSALFINVPEFAAKICTPQIFLWAAATGIVTCVIPYTLYTAGLSGIEAGTAAVLASVEPVAASVVGVALCGDEINIFKIIGMILVLGAIAVININKKLKFPKRIDK